MKRCWLIGNPVEHSLSPGMHKVIYDELGLDWAYEKRLITDISELEEFVKNVRDDVNCAGFNVTIPHKETIKGHITSVDKSAKAVGAVNTVVRKNGELAGYNTDLTGFRDDLEQNLGFKAAGKKILVIGCGGAGRAVVAGLREQAIEGYDAVRNFNSPCEIFLYDIDRKRALNVKNDFQDISIHLAETREKLYEILREADLVVNSSSIGMKEADPVIRLEKSGINEDLKVYDVVYNRETELIKEAWKLNLSACGGMGMLAGQGLAAFEKWYEPAFIGEGKKRDIKKKMIEYLKKEVNKND